MLLFQKELELIEMLEEGQTPLLEEFSKYGFTEEDIEFYKENRSWLMRQKYHESCGAYKTNYNELYHIADRIACESLMHKCEHAALIFTDHPENLGTIKKIYFSEIIKGSPSSVDTEPLRQKYSYENIIGMLHSHPELEDDSDELADWPSVSDLRGEKCIVGVIRPKKRKLFFYKIKAPYWTERENYFGFIALFLKRTEQEKLLKKYCLREEIELTPPSNNV